MKIALVKSCYSCLPEQVVHTYCPHPSKKDIEMLIKKHGNALACAEDALQYFHVACAPAVAGLPTVNRIRFLAVADKNVAQALMGMNKNTKDRARAVVQAAENMLTKLMVLTNEPKASAVAETASAVADTKLPPKPWACLPEDMEKKTETKLEAKVISYNSSGQATTAQDTLAEKTDCLELIDWEKWCGISSVENIMRNSIAKALAMDGVQRTSDSCN